jgi:2'-5' RNA ligase
MRVFIALELPEKIKIELEKIQQELKRAGVAAKWVKPELSHLTLAFLGSITPEKIEVVSQILQTVSQEISPVRLSFHQLDCFPSSAKSKVIFVALQGELGKLNALAIKIRKQLKTAEIYFDEKPFVAHLTLGRIKIPQDLRAVIGQIKIERQEFFGDKISLVKSTLTPSGPIYEKIVEKVLK